MKYTIKPGDTLGTIAKEFYGDPMKYTEIAEANGIDNPNVVEVGATLTLPGLDDSKVSITPESGSALTEEQLQAIIPKAKAVNIQFYLDSLNELMPKFEINTPLRQANFIAQLAHESGSFNYKVENLNYSAKALRSVFGKYFKTDEAADEYARKPEDIANIVYANRMGNGDTASGEGWKYRGRGLIQLTGKDNYETCGKSIGMDIVNSPDLLVDTANAAVSAAAWYWDSRKLNSYADQDDIKAITKRINGGYNGLEDREDYLQRAKEVLGIS